MQWHILILALVFLLIPFFIGTSFAQLDKFTFSAIKSSFVKQKTTKAPAPTSDQTNSQTGHSGELGGTDSTKIRLIVWEGAIDAWKNNPIFGTGVETFAFAYYKYRPPAHNLTSEWNFLYNKAHNEYLNYLATTGLFGLGTYLSIILAFFWIIFDKALKRFKVKELSFELLLVLALFAGYLSILVSNFFGFSVVIVNIYFFLIPALTLVLLEIVSKEKAIAFSTNKNSASAKAKAQKVKTYREDKYKTSGLQKFGILIIIAVSLYFVYYLYVAWIADKSYALGMNLDRAQQYQQAYQNLKTATDLLPSEPVFTDELAINNAVLSLMVLQSQKNATGSAALASQLAQSAITLTDKVTTEHPNNVVFAKTKVRVFYTLSQANPQYLPLALQAIQKAQLLAPTDANISYNLGVLYGQNGQIQKAIDTLQNTTKLKPDYRNAYYALGIFYHQAALDKNGKVTNKNNLKKAIETMKFIVKNLAPSDAQAKQAIKTWENQ